MKLTTNLPINTFAARRENLEARRELYSQIDLNKAMEKKQYNDYLRAVKNYLMLRPNSTAMQVASALSNDDDEQNSIRMSVQSLALSAKNRRVHMKNARGYEELIKEGQVKYVANGNFTPTDRNAPWASLPELASAVMEKTRHFIEVDDDGNEIGRQNITRTYKTYYLKEDA